jgi:hypothetical protein
MQADAGAIAVSNLGGRRLRLSSPAAICAVLQFQHRYQYMV